MVEAGTSRQQLWDAAGAMLSAAGIADGRREAIRLWNGLHRLDGAAAVLQRGEPVAASQAERFLQATGRRAAGEPLAHVVGWIGFRHLELRCDRRALIPRPETELLVELALARVRTGTAADIGTGTGALALSLAHEGTFDRVIGTDLSPDALALARENGARLGLDVTWHEGDLTAPLAGESVDLLVSNPPYLTTGELAGLDPAVAAWEPHLALASGADGLDATHRLLDSARTVIRSGGWIVLEVDVARAGMVATVAADLGWHDVAIHRDLFDRDRFCTARWKG